MWFLGKGKCKPIANFSLTIVKSLPPVSLSLSLSLYLSFPPPPLSLSLSLSLFRSLALSPRAPHTQYRKRFRASYNNNFGKTRSRMNVSVKTQGQIERDRKDVGSLAWEWSKRSKGPRQQSISRLEPSANSTVALTVSYRDRWCHQPACAMLLSVLAPVHKFENIWIFWLMCLIHVCGRVSTLHFDIKNWMLLQSRGFLQDW